MKIVYLFVLALVAEPVSADIPTIPVEGAKPMLNVGGATIGDIFDPWIVTDHRLPVTVTRQSSLLSLENILRMNIYAGNCNYVSEKTCIGQFSCTGFDDIDVPGTVEQISDSTPMFETSLTLDMDGKLSFKCRLVSPFSRDLDVKFEPTCTSSSGFLVENGPPRICSE